MAGVSLENTRQGNAVLFNLILFYFFILCFILLFFYFILFYLYLLSIYVHMIIHNTKNFILFYRFSIIIYLLVQQAAKQITVLLFCVMCFSSVPDQTIFCCVQLELCSQTNCPRK